jgi:hypothetical protein
MILHYINESGGLVCTRDKLPSGMHYEYVEQQNYIKIVIAYDDDGEVVGEYQGWQSELDLLSELGWS